MTHTPKQTLGSYDASDVEFLLKEVTLAPTSIDEKEKKIQSGEAHYSEMISEERRPDERYLTIFQDSRKTGDLRIAQDIVRLGHMIQEKIHTQELPNSIALCSLVRAGLPYGVMLLRELKQRGITVHHYGVSIIRDKGLDENAMNYVINKHGSSSVIFVDGWTGKGAISNELTKSWKALAGKEPIMAVVADPSGYATLSGSQEDWLIPSGILGANVSGLISRTILNKDLIGPEDFHGTMTVNHLKDIDISREFVNAICAIANTIRENTPLVSMDPGYLDQLRTKSKNCILKIQSTYGIENVNRIKPGIAEATRAVLRRKPEMVLVRHKQGDPDLSALLHLCQSDNIKVVESKELTGPYRAITLIGKAI